MEKDHLEMIFEDMNAKFDLVLEGYAALDKKLDTRFDELDEKIENNTFKIEVLNQKIDAVDAKLSKKIDDVDARLNKKIDAVAANLTSRLDAVAEDLSAHRRDTEVHRGYRVRED